MRVIQRYSAPIIKKQYSQPKRRSITAGIIVLIAYPAKKDWLEGFGENIRGE